MPDTLPFDPTAPKVLPKPGSIAFRNMDEPTFRAFTIRAQNFVCGMLGCDESDLASALEEYLNPDGRRAA